MNMSWGYQEWRFQSFCGATPSFSRASTRIQVKCQVAPEDEAAWWFASLKVLEQLSLKHAPLAHWLQCAQEVGEAGRVCPLAMGWNSLNAAVGVPAYPYERYSNEIEQSGLAPIAEGVVKLPNYLVLHLACPYGDFMRRSLQLIGVWLSWGHAAWQEGRLQLNREQLGRWCAEFDGLPKRLPAPSLMSMQYRLWQQGVGWDWLGKDRTRIGEGALQQVVKGASQALAMDAPEAWHIPIYTVTGSVGKTTTARLLWQLLQDSGKTLALAASDGAWIGRDQVSEGDCIGGVTARALLQSPLVDAAVFEQGRGGIVNQGVPYARSDVAILLNVQPVHLGLDGIETLEQMADTKAVGLSPARLWVMNLDDEQCLRVGNQHPPDTTLWFSVSADSKRLEHLSRTALGALGVERDAVGEPQALTVWQAGRAIESWPLKGVTPYHGLLGNKTLEELLAAVAATYFGPLALSGTSWPERLRALQLDGANHAFRTSVHRQGSVLFVLDKAGELASLRILKEAVDELARREGCDRRLMVLCRSAGEVPERHLESIKCLHVLMDEFVCFDRPESYTSKVALPIYEPGSIPVLLQDEWMRLNAEANVSKPATIVGDWTQAEAFLRQRLRQLPGKTLVLINQPSTSATELNQQILSFATTGLNDWSVGAGIEPHAHD